MYTWAAITWYYTKRTLGVFILVFIVIPLVVVHTLLLLPWTLYYQSANWSMRSADMPPVQVYLDQFEMLFPDLFRHVRVAHDIARAEDVGRPRKIEYWPSAPGQSGAEKMSKFSLAAELFSRLEAAGWKRRVLWTFLRSRVERSGRVNPQQKDAFVVVMEKMCHYQFRHKARAPIEWFYDYISWGGNFKDENRPMPLGMQIVQVEADSLDWLLKPDAFLIPGNRRVRRRLRTLTDFKLWGKVTKDTDLESGIAGYWQIIDLREGGRKPWES